MLQRGFLRLSKRKKSPTSSLSSIDSVRTNQDEWTKYDERLIDAAYKSDREKIKETIRKKGASPVKVSRDGQTALHISVKKGMNDCVDFMLAEQPDLSTIDLQGRTVYHIAASKGDPTMLKKLLSYSRWNLELKDTKEMTALHYAVASGDNECVKFLLDNNAPVDLRDGEGRTSLLTAIMNGYEKIAMTLILHGVDVNAADYKERTPIIMACIQGMRDVVALLISKGADSKIVDAEGKSLEMIASDAGHNDIVDILRNSADSGIMDIEHINDSGEDNVLVEKDELDLNENEAILIDEVKEKKNEEEEEEEEEDGKPERRRSHRRSILKSDDSSLTTSIIESLMGYDVGNETISESGAELKDKFEQDKQEMTNEIANRDKKIEELEQEINSLKKKLRWETEMRFQAEKEVIQLKSSVSNQVKSRTVTFDERDEFEEAEQEERVEVIQEEVEEENKDEEKHEDKNDEKHSENEAEHEDKVEGEEEHEKEYDTDDSVSWETGYRKKSLGTAKQHIDMLEEHILSLEDDIVHKDSAINELESKLKSARELVDLNNNTTVSLDVFNKYKAEKKTERNTYKDQIKTFETQLQELQENLRNTQDNLQDAKCDLREAKNDLQDAQNDLRDTRTDLQEAETESETLRTNFETDIEEKNNYVNTLMKEYDELQSKLSEQEIQYAKDVSCYRENLLALYQSNIDEHLEEALKKIIKLRSS